MSMSRYTHVSIVAADLDRSVVKNLVERTDVRAPDPDEPAAPIYMDG